MTLLSRTLLLACAATLLSSCRVDTQDGQLSRETRAAPTVDKASREADLVSRYAGTIDARTTGDALIRSMKQSRLLMTEWNPISFSITTVKAVMGDPTSESAESVEYRFDNGWDGDVWVFQVEDETVIGLHLFSIP